MMKRFIHAKDFISSKIHLMSWSWFDNIISMAKHAQTHQVRDARHRSGHNLLKTWKLFLINIIAKLACVASYLFENCRFCVELCRPCSYKEKEIVFENLISFLYQIAPIKCKWCEIISFYITIFYRSN